MNRHRTSLIVLLAVLSLGAGSPGQSDIAVRLGWGNTYRAGRWHPIYITGESSPPREVVAHVEGMHNPPRAMSIAHRFALSPAETTHTVFFPLGEPADLRRT